MDRPLPQTLLQDVLWTCSARRYPDRDAFSAAVRQHQIDIRKADTWEPDAVALPVPRALIQFLCWEADDQVEPRFPIESPRSDHFTALDLLYGACDGIARHLVERGARLGDHCFFEGFSLLRARPGEPPVYFVRFGS